MSKKPIFQNHHIIYANPEKRIKEVTRRVRKGVHQTITLIRRYSFLTNQEIDTIKLELELKRKYENE